MSLWEKPIRVLFILFIALMDLKIIIDFEFIRPIEKYSIVVERKTNAEVLDFSKIHPEEAISLDNQEEQTEEEKDGSESDQTNFDSLASALSDDPVVEKNNSYQLIEPEIAEEPVAEPKTEITTTTESETTSSSETESTPEPESTPETSSTGSDIAETAKKYEGYSYVAGGASPEGFDCSGFTQYIYGLYGIRLNRVANAQADNGTPINREELQPGDLVLFSYYGSDSIGHSGIYIGDGDFIHAANAERGVVIDTLESGYYLTNYVTARRLF